MERHVSSYGIHLNVCVLGNWRTKLTDFSLPFLTQEVADDISYIQSQNRGLQVQTQNQRALMAEIANLLVCLTCSRSLTQLIVWVYQETVDVDQESLVTLTQESLEKSKSVQKLEEAAADLYKALQAGRDRGLQKFGYGFTHDGTFSHTISFLDMAAGMERFSEYRTYNSQFCKRVSDYLSIMFTAQVP